MTAPLTNPGRRRPAPEPDAQDRSRAGDHVGDRAAGNLRTGPCGLRWTRRRAGDGRRAGRLAGATAGYDGLVICPDPVAVPMSELTARFDLPLGLSAPAAARHAVRAVLSAWGLREPAWLDDAQIVVSELVTNAVRHGGGCISLDLQLHDGTITVGAADGSSVVPCRRAGDDDGGRGLAIIEALVRRWGYTITTAASGSGPRCQPAPGAGSARPGAVAMSRRRPRRCGPSPSCLVFDGGQRPDEWRLG